MLQIIVLSHGKHHDTQQKILGGADELGIGVALLVVEDKGTDPAQGAKIGEHGAGNKGASVQQIFNAPGKEGIADSSWQQYQHHAKQGHEQQVPGQGEYPETQQGECGVHADNVEADDFVDGIIGNPMAMVHKIPHHQGHD